MHSFVLAQMNPLVMVAIIAVIVILALIFFAVFARFISLYIQCWMTGTCRRPRWPGLPWPVGDNRQAASVSPSAGYAVKLRTKPGQSR